MNDLAAPINEFIARAQRLPNQISISETVEQVRRRMLTPWEAAELLGLNPQCERYGTMTMQLSDLLEILPETDDARLAVARNVTP